MSFFREALSEFLSRDCPVSCTENAILQAIVAKVHYAEWGTGKNRLVLIRLSRPVQMRDEVFLGNLLLNSFLGRTAAVGLENAAGPGRCLNLASDIESYFYLVRTDKSLDELAAAAKEAWLASLPSLYFDMPDQKRGLFGSLVNRLNSYRASFIQPFPLMVVPKAWARRMEMEVRRYLMKAIQAEWPDSVANILANIAFFYGTDGYEVQSPVEFLVRLVTRHSILNGPDLARAVNLPDGYDFSGSGAKDLIAKLIKENAFYADEMGRMLTELLQAFGKSIDSGSLDWLMPYHTRKGTMLDLPPEEVLDEVLRDTVIGGRVCSASSLSSSHLCRMCGIREARLEGATIISNDSFTRFHNQEIHGKDGRLCITCALCAYLHIGLTGTATPVKGPVPKRENVVFFYSDLSLKELLDLKDRIAEEIERWQTSKSVSSEGESPLQKAARASRLERELEAILKGTDVSQVHIFPLGIGASPLNVILLPESFYLESKRFQKSRYVVSHILLWLREHLGANSSLFFNSLPDLSRWGLDSSQLMVVNGSPIDPESEYNRLEYLREIVWSLSRHRIKEGLKYRMVVAERMEQDPFGTFSHLIRENLDSLSISAAADVCNKLYALREVLSG